MYAMCNFVNSELGKEYLVSIIFIGLMSTNCSRYFETRLWASRDKGFDTDLFDNFYGFQTALDVLGTKTYHRRTRKSVSEYHLTLTKMQYYYWIHRHNKKNMLQDKYGIFFNSFVF